MTYAPSALDGDHEWDEEYVITSVRDVYDDPRYDRVVEFFTQHGGLRTAPINRLRVVGGTDKLPRSMGEDDIRPSKGRHDGRADRAAIRAARGRGLMPPADQPVTKPKPRRVKRKG